ncbi:MAG: hypothetical protein HGB20_09140 [Chlorobiaceae bacterium]|nr:hypothetical protein [Chlorobiaceae bacterium]
MIRLSELLVIVAFALFLAGAARSFRTEGDRYARLVMFIAVLLDMLAAFLPAIGLQTPIPLAPERKPLVGLAVLAGVFVWVLSGTLLVIYSPKRLGWYHALVLATEIVWFIDIMMFLYGAYGSIRL